MDHHHQSPWIAPTNYHYSSHWLSTVLWPPTMGVYPKEKARSKMYMNEIKTTQAHIKTKFYFISLTYTHTSEFLTIFLKKTTSLGNHVNSSFLLLSGHCVWQQLKPSQLHKKITQKNILQNPTSCWTKQVKFWNLKFCTQISIPTNPLELDW